MVGMGAHALGKVVSSRDGRKKSILQMFQLSLRAESDARKFRKAYAVAEIERQTRLGEWEAEGWRRYQLEHWMKWNRKRTIDNLSRMHRPLDRRLRPNLEEALWLWTRHCEPLQKGHFGNWMAVPAGGQDPSRPT